MARLPVELRMKAILFAKRATGMNRPIREHRVLIEAWEVCFTETERYLKRKYNGEETKKRRD